MTALVAVKRVCLREAFKYVDALCPGLMVSKHYLCRAARFEMQYEASLSGAWASSVLRCSHFSCYELNDMVRELRAQRHDVVRIEESMRSVYGIVMHLFKPDELNWKVKMPALFNTPK